MKIVVDFTPWMVYIIGMEMRETTNQGDAMTTVSYSDQSRETQRMLRKGCVVQSSIAGHSISLPNNDELEARFSVAMVAVGGRKESLGWRGYSLPHNDAYAEPMGVDQVIEFCEGIYGSDNVFLMVK